MYIPGWFRLMVSNSSKVDVSIIVLTYNRPDEISRNIKQLLALNTQNLEIIVVDNASDQPVGNI